MKKEQLTQPAEELLSSLEKEAKPGIEIINDTPFLILHDIRKIREAFRDNDMSYCTRHNIFDFHLIKFTMDEVRDAVFSTGSESGKPCLCITLNTLNGTERYLVAEKFEDIRDILDFAPHFEN